MSQVRVNDNDDEFTVWLNPDAAKYSGLCVGFGKTRRQAIADAIDELHGAIIELQQEVAMADDDKDETTQDIQEPVREDTRDEEEQAAADSSSEQPAAPAPTDNDD